MNHQHWLAIYVCWTHTFSIRCGQCKGTSGRLFVVLAFFTSRPVKQICLLCTPCKGIVLSDPLPSFCRLLPMLNLIICYKFKTLLTVLMAVTSSFGCLFLMQIEYIVVVGLFFFSLTCHLFSAVKPQT